MHGITKVQLTDHWRSLELALALKDDQKAKMESCSGHDVIWGSPQVMSAVPLMTTCIVEAGHLPACKMLAQYHIRLEKKPSNTMSGQGMVKKWKTFNLMIYINLQCCRRSWRSMLSQREISASLCVAAIWSGRMAFHGVDRFPSFQKCWNDDPGSSWYSWSKCPESQPICFNQWF